MGAHASEVTCCLERTREKTGVTSCRGEGLTQEPKAGIEERWEAWAEGSGELRAQESLDGGVDVPARGDQGLQVGLTIDEAHGVELLQLLLKPYFWHLYL